MTCDEIQELLIDYVDGALDAGARARVEAHTGECGGCRSRLNDLRAVFGSLRAYELPERDDLFWRRLQKGVKDRIGSQPQHAPAVMRRMAKPAAALVAALLFMTIVSVYNRLHIPKQDSIFTTSEPAPASESLTNREKAIIVATTDTNLYRATDYRKRDKDKDEDENVENEFPFDDIEDGEIDDQHIDTLDTGVPGEYQIPEVIHEMSDEEAADMLDEMTPAPDENVRS